MEDFLRLPIRQVLATVPFDNNMIAVIMASGAFPRKEYPSYLLQSADYVVCCDGALQTMEKHGFVPSAVVGDMDSVCGRALRRVLCKVGRLSGKVLMCDGEGFPKFEVVSSRSDM